MGGQGRGHIYRQYTVRLRACPKVLQYTVYIYAQGQGPHAHTVSGMLVNDRCKIPRQDSANQITLFQGVLILTRFLVCRLSTRKCQKYRETANAVSCM
jgi:hypothetical protein